MTTTLTAEPDTATIGAEPAVLDSSRTYPYYLEVDPRDLRATGNSREVGDILQTRPDLVASMAAHGFDSIASVINVAPDPDDGVLGVLVGFHRTAAAVAVIEHADPELANPDLRVGALVHAPGTTRQQVLLAQGVENIHREDFTVAEEASYYHQLALVGLDDDAVARELGKPIDRVRAGRTVAASVPTRAAMQQLPEIDLVTMAKLAEFADDEAVHQGLVNTLRTFGPRRLDYEIRSVLNRRERQNVEVAECDRLTEQGYVLIEDEEEPPEGTVRLEDLVAGQDTSSIDPEQHTGCPGRAVYVFVDSDLEVEITHFCVDAAEHGHRLLVEVNVENAERQLREQGVRLLDPGNEDANQLMCELRRLFADADAEHTLTAAEHADCPGHAAYVTAQDYGTDAVVHWVCADYPQHGHVVQVAAPAAHTERDAAYQSAERKRARVNNAAWKVAKQARRAWLTEFFSDWRTRTVAPAKSAPKTRATATASTKAKASTKRPARPLPAKAQHWLGLAQTLANDHFHDAAPSHHYACTLLGLAQPTGHKGTDNPITARLRGKSTSEPQAIMIQLALVIGACEEHWDLQYTNNAEASWRGTSEDSRFYFELLAALGHELSPVERLVNDPAADVAEWPHLQAAADAKAV
jgi:ParB family chromosome partitioning protein